MKKGISPVVAVVLLIAIAVIAAVGLYFWVGGLATKQPTPSEPSVISAVCTGGTVIVSNIGNTAVGGDLADTQGNVDVGNVCSNLAAGASCRYNATFSGSGVIYDPVGGGQAPYNC